MLMARQLKNGLGIRRRKTPIRRLTPRQPYMLQVLAFGQCDRYAARHGQTEHMLGIVRDTRRIPMSPDGINLIDIGELPVAKVLSGHVGATYPYTRLFKHLAHRRLTQVFLQTILGARDRLPEAGLVRALDQQHLQVRCVNDDEDGFGDFVGHHEKQLICHWIMPCLSGARKLPSATAYARCNSGPAYKKNGRELNLPAGVNEASVASAFDSRLHRSQTNMQLAQLLLVDCARCLRQQTLRALGLGESDHVTD